MEPSTAAKCVSFHIGTIRRLCLGGWQATNEALRDEFTERLLNLKVGRDDAVLGNCPG